MLQGATNRSSGNDNFPDAIWIRIVGVCHPSSLLYELRIFDLFLFFFLATFVAWLGLLFHGAGPFVRSSTCDVFGGTGVLLCYSCAGGFGCYLAFQGS